MATVPHVTSGLGLRKFQVDGFLLTLLYNTRYRTSNINRKVQVLTALPGVLHARVLLLATRFHPHHAVVGVSDSVRATHRCEHGGTLGGAQAFGMAVRGLNAVGPVGTVRLLAWFCNRTVATISVSTNMGRGC